MDYASYADDGLEPVYEVEFADADGVTQALVTLCAVDSEVGWRPDPGPQPAS